jgi:crotonobetainyl-CoA:carnitine CoA-transferase CaiB-like acyl-CoA transferase
MDGHRFGLHQPVPHAGEHTREVLTEAGYSVEQISNLLAAQVVEAQQAV